MVIIEEDLVLLVEPLARVEPPDDRLDAFEFDGRQSPSRAESDHFCATLKGQVLARILVSLS